MEKLILDSPVIDISSTKDPTAVSDIEKQAVLDIFKFIYDYYKVIDGDDEYAIKISYLSGDTSLELEAKNLDKVNTISSLNSKPNFLIISCSPI